MTMGRESVWPHRRVITNLILMIFVVSFLFQGVYYLNEPTEPFSNRFGSEEIFKLGKMIGMKTISFMHFMISSICLYGILKKPKGSNSAPPNE